MRRYLSLAFSLLFACSAAPRAPTVLGPPPTAASPSQAPASGLLTRAQVIVASDDRSPEDRLLDAGRQPAQLLAFLGVAPGMRVAELAAGGGYTTELLARAVGETGTVYGQNSKFLLERFAEQPWSERLAKPIMRRIVRVDREFEEPLPPEATNLDAVVCVLFYHDTVWLKTDRARMNRSVLGALKPGGTYLVVDHSAQPGAGISVAESLHRIEESTLTSELQAAGFVLEQQADFLRNPSDARDWNASPRAAGERRGQSDRFVLKFSKP